MASKKMAEIYKLSTKCSQALQQGFFNSKLMYIWHNPIHNGLDIELETAEGGKEKRKI